MENKFLSNLLTPLLLLVISSIASASPIYTQTPQGGYSSYVLGGSQWSTFTGLVTSQNTINQYADFENSITLSSYGVVWVDQELSSSLSATEITNLQNYYNSNNTEALVILDSNWNDNSYINNENNMQFAANIASWLADTSTNKIVLIGENNSWTSWNQSIMNVVGGGYDSACNWDIGSPVSSHILTSGVNTVQNICGSTISLNQSLGNPDILFSNNFAAIYRSRSADVSEPSALLLLSFGLVGLVFSARKRVNF